MKGHVWALGAGILLLAAPVWASAQKKEATKKEEAAAPKASAPKAADAAELTTAATKGAATPQKPRVIDFEDETIRGTLTKPEGDFIDSRKLARQRSLIKIRRHFVPELLKSADDI